MVLKKKKKKFLDCIESAQLLQQALNDLNEGKANYEQVDALRKTAVDIAKLYSLNKREQENSDSSVSKEIKEYLRIK